MHSKPERQQAILNLLGQNEIHSQAELQELLEAEEVHVRDSALRALLDEVVVDLAAAQQQVADAAHLGMPRV